MEPTRLTGMILQRTVRGDRPGLGRDGKVSIGIRISIGIGHSERREGRGGGGETLKEDKAEGSKRKGRDRKSGVTVGGN